MLSGTRRTVIVILVYFYSAWAEIDFDHDEVIQLEGTLEQKINELNRRLEVLNRIELNQGKWNEF